VWCRLSVDMCSDTEGRQGSLTMRVLAKTVELQRQVVDYQTLVSSLNAKLCDVTAQLNDCQQRMRQDGTRRRTTHPLPTRPHVNSSELVGVWVRDSVRVRIRARVEIRIRVRHSGLGLDHTLTTTTTTTMSSSFQLELQRSSTVLCLACRHAFLPAVVLCPSLECR